MAQNGPVYGAFLMYEGKFKGNILRYFYSEPFWNSINLTQIAIKCP